MEASGTQSVSLEGAVSRGFRGLSPKQKENVRRALGFLNGLGARSEHFERYGLNVCVSEDRDHPVADSGAPVVDPASVRSLMEDAYVLWQKDEGLRSNYPLAEEGIVLLHRLEKEARLTYNHK